MIIINTRESNNITASYKISPSIRDVIGHMVSALKYEFEINNVDATINQGDALTNCIRHALESAEPAYLISNKKYTYAELMKAEFERNYAIVKQEIPNSIKQYSQKYFECMSGLEEEYNNENEKEEPYYLYPDISEILNISIEKIYPSGLAYIQMLDQYCNSKFEDALREAVLHIIKLLVESEHGKESEGGLLLRIDDVSRWEL